nr:hypothetical protein [Streptomyces hygroscopicus]
MPMPLEPGESVPSQEAFAAFLTQLTAECRHDGVQWENATLERFLEALAAWVASGPGWYEHHQHEPLPTDGNWTYFAHALVAATMYE